MNKAPKTSAAAAALRRRAEGRLRERPQNQKPAVAGQRPAVGALRTLHELQVHQIELEMQNTELQEARNRMEAQLEKYTDLYDFAPIGYFSLDEQGVMLEVNLTGATLLGVERSRLIHRRLLHFVAPTSQPILLAFLDKVFAQSGKQVCEALLLKEDGGVFWADLQAVSAVLPGGPRKRCQVAVSDITALKRADEAQRRMETLAASNQVLKREILQRLEVVASLKKSEQNQIQLLKKSRHQQEQLRHLAHQLLSAQEEERKKISRELHDVIAQTLTGINIRLATLNTEAAVNTKSLRKKITSTQRLVEKSVDIVHRFARELRPAVLDDLGLIPALHSLMKNFTARTGVRARLTAFAGVEQLNPIRRTVLFRVAQEALTNIARHAQASQVELNIQKLPRAVCMKIKDNGKSFPVQRTLHAKKNKRLGILGMRERVEMVGGSFTVESVPGQGTTICAHIPIGKVSKRGKPRWARIPK